MRKVAGKLRLDLVQYRNVAAFAQFGTGELDKTTIAQLERGKRTTQVLVQPQYAPVPLEKQVMVLYAATSGLIDSVPVEKVGAFEAGLYRFMDANHPEIGKAIAVGKTLSAEAEAALKAAILEYKKTENY
jgi:F-type H+-transporting ATPase subunit alpha